MSSWRKVGSMQYFSSFAAHHAAHAAHYHSYFDQYANFLEPPAPRFHGNNFIEQYLYSLPEYRTELQRSNFIEIYSYNGLLATRKVIEFDGDTVLCRVCGDKASGFHYGVHACEGCKGFFRRSIQQKIQYRPCLKNQQCNIMRVNRNRCQYCRLKKCIAVGMSRDAVRFGRVPKKEKAKIIEQMQRVNIQTQGHMLNAVLENETEVVQKIINAHMKQCEYTRGKIKGFLEKAWGQQQYVNCPAHMACPLNPSPETSDGSKRWEEFSECFTPAIRNVVSFAKCIPGFQLLSQEDQVTLLKAGTFEVLLVHLSCLFDSQSNTMMFTNGKLFKRSSLTTSNCAGFLLDSMFDFSDRMNQLHLTDEEIALFSAIVIIASDRPGLRYMEQVERVQSRITQGLQKLMSANHPEDSALFAKLLMKIPDLRTLNTLHSEKLLGLTVPASTSSKTSHQSSSKVKANHSPQGTPFMQGMFPSGFPLYSTQMMPGSSQERGIPYPPRPPEVPQMSLPIANGNTPNGYPPFHPYNPAYHLAGDKDKGQGHCFKEEPLYGGMTQAATPTKAHSPRSAHNGDALRPRDEEAARMRDDISRSRSEVPGMPLFPPGLSPVMMPGMHQLYGREPPTWLAPPSSVALSPQEARGAGAEGNDARDEQRKFRKRSLGEEESELSKISRMWENGSVDGSKSGSHSSHTSPTKYLSPNGSPIATWRPHCPYSQAMATANGDKAEGCAVSMAGAGRPLDLPVLKSALNQPPLTAQQSWLPWQQNGSHKDRDMFVGAESLAKPGSPARDGGSLTDEHYMLHKKLKMKRRSSSERSTPEEGGRHHSMERSPACVEVINISDKDEENRPRYYGNHSGEQQPPVLNDVYHEQSLDGNHPSRQSPPRLSPVTELRGPYLNGHPEKNHERPPSSHDNKTMGSVADSKPFDAVVMREKLLDSRAMPSHKSPIIHHSQDYDKLHLDPSTASPMSPNKPYMKGHSKHTEMISDDAEHAMKYKLKDPMNGLAPPAMGGEKPLRLNGHHKDKEDPAAKVAFPGGPHPAYMGFPAGFHPALMYQYNQYAAMHQQLAQIQQLQMAQLAQAQLYAAREDPRAVLQGRDLEDTRELKDNNQNSIPHKSQPLNLATDKVKAVPYEKDVGRISVDRSVKQEPVM